MTSDDFKPPTPDEPLTTKPTEQCGYDSVMFQRTLDPIAGSLGLKIVKVVHDGWRFRFWTRLKTLPNECYEIDSGIVDELDFKHQSKALGELLIRCLEELQMKIVDTTRETLDKIDRRGRIANLSKEDKHTLHDMLMAATEHEMRDFYRAEQGCKNVDRYRALISRLFA
jgi:hypothetical protein